MLSTLPALPIVGQVAALTEHVEKLMLHLKHEATARVKAEEAARQCMGA